MASRPVDFVSGLGALPNPQKVLDDSISVRLGQERDALQNQQLAAQGQILRAEGTASQQKADDAEAYKHDIASALAAPTAAGFSDLFLKYPAFKDNITKAWDAREEFTRRADLSQLGQIHAALRSGRKDLAIATLRTRMDADRAAQVPADDEDKRLYDALTNDDPNDDAAALGMTGAMLAAVVGPEKYGQTYEAVNGDSKAFTLAPGSKRFGADGALIAEAPFQDRYLQADPEKDLVRIPGAPSPAPDQPFPDGDNVPSLISTALPGAQITSATRSREEQDALIARGATTAKNSYHLTGQAVDVRPVEGMTFAQARARVGSYAAKNGQRLVEAIDETTKGTGPHWHFAIGPRQGSSPVSRTPGGVEVVSAGRAKPKEPPAGYRWLPNGALQPIAGGPADKPSSGSGVMGDPRLTGAPYLATLPKSLQATVQAVSDGRIPPPRAGSKFGQSLLQAVAQFDPTFDAANANTRSATRKDFTSGKAARNVSSLNTALGHMGDLIASYDALGNGGTPAANWLRNQGLRATGGAGKIKAFETNVNAVADELETAFRGSSGTLAGTESWHAAFSAASSPSEFQDVVKKAYSLLNSRIEALGDQYSQGMGKTQAGIKLLNPHARQTARRIQQLGRPASGAGGFKIIARRPAR